MKVEAASYPEHLQCPYPGCAGAVAEAEIKNEVVACPRCDRLAARCPHGHSRRCPTLNRALARHCRNCGLKLDTDWARNQWSHDLAAAGHGADNGSVRRSLMLENDPQIVLSLKGWMQFRSWSGGWPLTLHEAAGRLWIAAPDSSLLSVDPFRSTQKTAPVSSEPLWPDARGLRVRAVSAGPWLVLHADRGIRLLNLLSVDAPRHREHYTSLIWTARPDERLASAPVFLRYSSEGLDSLGRLLAWTTHGSKGLSLWLAPLTLAGTQRVQPRQFILQNIPMRPLAPGASPDPVVLAAAPLGGRDALFLCTTQQLWLIEAPGPQSRELPRSQKLLSKPHFLLYNQDMVGMVYAPGSSPAEGEEPRGTLFVAYRDGEGPAAQDLLEIVTIGEQGLVENFSGLDQSGVPIDAIRTSREREVLTVAGGALLRCNAHGNQVRVLNSEYLLGMMRGHVYQDIAVCTGFDASPGQSHWVTMLVDLVEGSRITNGLLLTESLEAHPLLLGNFFFTLERVQGELCLTRRRLIPQRNGPLAS